MADPKAPTGEVGGAGIGGLATRGGWALLAQEGEHVPELRWPDNVRVFERMLFTDSQVQSLYLGTTLPLLDYVWWLEPGEADRTYAEALAGDLGLPIEEPPDDEPYQPIEPGRYRFNFLEHLSEALLAMAYGHYYFEQVGVIGDDGLWHLRKLGPRAPQTIEEFDVAPDGGLRAIRQSGILTSTGSNGALMAGRVPPIPVDRLVAYVWQADSRARWTGRSMLRSLYRHWLVKDRLIRVDAINHERAGGVPYVTTDQTYQGQSLDDLQELAAEFRVGEDGGAALPPGAKLNLARAGGTDIVASINYHDDSMARVWSAMVRQLAQGGDSANRAVGQTFAGLEDLARRAVGRWFAMTFREHVIEDWWTWNLGEGLPHPILACKPRNDAGVAAPGPTPSSGPGGGAAPPDPTQAAAGTPSPRQRPVRVGGAVAASAFALPARDLRRQPYEWELRAAVDFAAIDLAYDDAVTRAHALWLESVIPGQVSAVADGIVLTKSGEPRKRVTRSDMARLAAPVDGADALRDLLLPVARAAAAQAVGEAVSQGFAIPMPDDAALAGALADHATAVAVQSANGLSLSAQRKAVQLVGGRSPAELAAEVVDYLHGLKHQWTLDQLQGSVQAAQNVGRFAVFSKAPADHPVRFHSSELLDVNTCSPCSAIDGREYDSIEAATRDYPTGGYMDCEGGPRCRGTVVAVFDEL